jgi:hypothetical protein
LTTIAICEIGIGAGGCVIVLPSSASLPNLWRLLVAPCWYERSDHELARP